MHANRHIRQRPAVRRGLLRALTAHNGASSMWRNARACFKRNGWPRAHGLSPLPLRGRVAARS
jgi:hypothetical protein